MKHPKEWLYPSEISRNDNWILTGPRNTWDCNYHIINRNTNIDHLIDTEDMRDSGIDPYIPINDNDIDLLIELTWKQKTYEF